MTHTANAVVIGTGVIGAAVAYELAQTGLRVVAIDRLGGVGSGSTSSSSSIVRFHYSTFGAWPLPGNPSSAGRTGPNIWAAVLRNPWQVFIKSGCLTLDGSTRVSGCCLSLTASMSHTSAGVLRPSGSGTGSGSRTVRSAQAGHGCRILRGCRRRTRCLLHARRRVHRRPAAGGEEPHGRGEAEGDRNSAPRTGGGILQKNARVQGIRLRSGSVIQSPVVVNAAGPYSGQVNALAGVAGEFRIRTRPLRQEVHSVRPRLISELADCVPERSDTDGIVA